MPKKKKKTGGALHPRNRHIGKYDLEALSNTNPELKDYIIENANGDPSIAFAEPAAVRALNKALLMHYYGIKYWTLPQDFLCPPVPGRADYVHHLAELMSHSNVNKNKVPEGSNINILDIGVGASCIYPIIANKEYEWSFIGAELDKLAIKTAANIIQENDISYLDLRKQTSDRDVFKGILEDGEIIDATICNPPFHSSKKAAEAATQRKVNALKTNLSQKDTPTMNFGGRSNELWCLGGELAFITNMMYQSVHYKTSCMWFTSLVSNQSNLNQLYKILEKIDAFAVKTIPMGTGNKRTRIIAWTFLDLDQQETWSRNRWS